MSPAQPQTFVVDLSGELTIRTVATAHAELSVALEAQAAVSAGIDPEAQVDLTFVQLIESARRTAADTGRAFALAGPAEGALLETLRRGGFMESAGQRAFWLHQSEDC